MSDPSADTLQAAIAEAAAEDLADSIVEDLRRRAIIA